MTDSSNFVRSLTENSDQSNWQEEYLQTSQQATGSEPNSYSVELEPLSWDPVSTTTLVDRQGVDLTVPTLTTLSSSSDRTEVTFPRDSSTVETGQEIPQDVINSPPSLRDNFAIEQEQNVYQNEPNYVEGEVIVKLHSGVQNSEIVSLQESLGASVLATTDRLGIQLWSIRGASVEQAISSTENNPLIEYIEPNYIQSTQAIPNDPEFDQLWGLNNTGQTGGILDVDIDAPEAWDLSTGNEIVVGVIDTGVDYTHPDLVNNMWINPGETAGNGIDDDGNGYIDDIYGWDFINDDNDPFDDQGHGTHVAGTIAAEGNNELGVIGVAPDAQIMALKFLGPSGGSTFDAIQAVEYATMMKEDYGVNMTLTNNSWGGGGYSQALYDAIEAAGEAGQLFVTSAGNSALNTDVNPSYPAAYDLDNIISVAATDHNDQLAGFSNYGSTTVDLGAPGVSIFSTLPGEDYSNLSGTSMASPHVAGVLALLASANPDLTIEELQDQLFDYLDPVEALQGTTATGGRLNAFNSLTETEPLSGEVYGSTWNDLNSNGIWDDGEPGLEGWTVFLDENTNGELDENEISTITDENGEYSFTDLIPGIYTIDQVIEPGWVQSYPANAQPYSLFVGSGAIVEDLNFGNWEIADAPSVSIQGSKWHDLNADGIWDEGEHGVEGWTIFLDDNNNDQLDPGELSTTTDAAGNYTFTDLSSGIYTVAEVQQPGWVQTYPIQESLPNGSFESNDFTSWGIVGATSITAADFGSDPSDGTYHALLTNGGSAVPDADLETFLGLSPGSLDGLENGNATVGSAIKQTLTVSAGDQVSFDYNFLTNEGTPSSFNDFAFVSITSETLDTLENTESVFVSSPTSFNEETEYGTFTHTFATSGTFTLGVGVMDVLDTAVDSGLLVDNFLVTGNSYTVNLNPGEVAEDLNFGNQQVEITPTPVFGTPHHDELDIFDSPVMVFAGDGNDIIDGSQSLGDNRYYGGNGDDIIFANTNDRAFGEAGNDTLFAGDGDNLLHGGEDVDQFWVAFGDLPETANTIVDFESGVDLIGIGGLGVSDLNDLNIAQDGDNALLGLGNTDIAILQGVQGDTLTNDNFIFV